MHIILTMLVVAKALKEKCFHLSNPFVGLVVLSTSLFSYRVLKNRSLTDQGTPGNHATVLHATDSHI